MKYQVIVGNIGTICDTNDKSEAAMEYEICVSQSKSSVGRIGGEDVTMMSDGEPTQEYVGSLSAEY